MKPITGIHRPFTWEEIHQIYSQYHRDRIAESKKRSKLYKLSHLSTRDRQFVLKELRPEFAKDVEWVREFIQEARFLRRFRREESILQMHGFFCQGGGLFILQEYVDGKNLAQFLSDYQLLSGNKQPLEEDLSCWVGIGICDGLDVIHRKDLIHVDLNPSNIMITAQEEPRVKIIDFGSAIDLSSPSKRNVPLTVTIPYISPEHQPGQEAVNKQSDIFCLGMILFGLLIGSDLSEFIPLAKFDPIRMTDAVLEHLVKSSISSTLKKILNRMLCIDLNQRYQLITNVHEDLKKFLKEAGASDTAIREKVLRILAE